jgi:quercetin dioxygenase-like cupin family protein
MVESGRGVTQVRGGPIEVAGPGEPWWTAAGVEHWHGAHPNEDVVQWTFYAGSPTWLEPVLDAQYRAPTGR